MKINSIFGSALIKQATLLFTMVFVGAGYAMAEDKSNDVIDMGEGFTTEQVLQLKVELGPTEHMGKSSDGVRINYPIIGGTFEGKGMKGTIVPGGADFAIEREDGAIMVSALYRIKTDDGQIIIIQNDGIWRANEDGKTRMAKGLEPLPSQVYAKTMPVFHTQPGKYSWLSDYMFFGTIDTQDYGVLITIYRLN